MFFLSYILSGFNEHTFYFNNSQTSNSIGSYDKVTKGRLRHTSSMHSLCSFYFTSSLFVSQVYLRYPFCFSFMKNFFEIRKCGLFYLRISNFVGVIVTVMSHNVAFHYIFKHAHRDIYISFRSLFLLLEFRIAKNFSTTSVDLKHVFCKYNL